jgi:dCTP deaminase
MILSGRTIREEGIVFPHVERTQTVILDGKKTASYGESFAGYDVRLGQSVMVFPGRTALAVTYEKFTMPNDVLGVVHDKSTWARLGLQVQNTVLEPGWQGHLTLELTWVPIAQYDRFEKYDPYLWLHTLWPIAQIVFHRVDSACVPYDGKYQNQGPNPQEAL